MLRLTTFLLLTLLTACAADSAPIDKDDPFGFRGPVAGGPAAERPASAPKDVGLTTSKLDYSTVNSNGGAISSETSNKKAALRLWVMQWNDRQWTCNNGEKCTRNDNPGRYWVRLGDCVDGSTPNAYRQCTIYHYNDAYPFEFAWGLLEYKQSSNTFYYWLWAQEEEFAEGLKRSSPPSRLRVY